ncbi:hypothetical protein vseg_021287 [Gypsophila vaccaria]
MSHHLRYDDDNININQDTHPSYCPSFSTYSTTQRPTLADTASRVVDEYEDQEFEFDVSGNIDNSPGSTPVYPVFNRELIPHPVELRKLFYAEDVGDYDDDLKAVSPETYCLWAPKSPLPSPSPTRCPKSGSTGSTAAAAATVSKTWRLRNLLRRCKSDGKEGLMLVGGGESSKEKSSPPRVSASPRRCGGGKNKEAAGTTTRRKSYLPYKQELLGFFGSPQTLRRINIPPF